MESPKPELTHIGKRIRAALDAESDPTVELRAARARLLERVAVRSMAGRERPGRHDGARPSTAVTRGRVLALGGALAMAAALVVWLRMPISFQVEAGAARSSGRLGDVIEATATTPVRLRFSEGSSIAVDPGGRVRVLAAEPKGARVLVESGGLDVSIVHRRRRTTRWNFEAGPFRVLVTGTKFHVAWSPQEQIFTLGTKEGSVLVSGACLAEPRAVAAGGSVRLSCPPSSVAALDREPAPTARPAAAPPVDGTSPIAKEAPAGTTWRQLLAAGRLTDGLRAAERANFARVCRTANQKELLTLADAARLSGRSARAIEALSILRKRFPGSTDAATAAFALGRITFEKGGAYTEAVRWFATYLDEQPNGPLMGDAVGRLMEARHGAGDRQGARADAERYLHRFPEGPYASEARTMLSE